MAKGVKSGSRLAALRPFLAGRLPSGAFPASGLASRFALRLWTRSVAFVTLPGLGFDFGTLPPIRGQGAADIVGLNERRAQLVAAHIPFIGAGIDQLSLASHLITFEWVRNDASSFPYPSEGCDFLGHTG